MFHIFRRPPRTVLWGGRRGDVQYASRDFWRHNLPFGVPTLTVDAPAYFDVGELVEALTIDGDVLRVMGKEGKVLAVSHADTSDWLQQP